MPADLQDQLRDLFGLEDFRPAQREVIEDVVGGRDVLCVMPTGAGKSLCYQLPAVVMGGLAIVVSPLISLMRDQVEQLRDAGVSAMLLNSTLSPDEQHEAIDAVIKGFKGLLYVAPERFSAGGFQRVLDRIRPALLAIDEAHCISQWGHDFRPDYYRLGEVRKRLGSPRTIALTATATEEVRQDIIAQLGLDEPSVYVTGFDRPNLRYESKQIRREDEKLRELLRLVRKNSGSGIIYCATRATVDELASLLLDQIADRGVFAYHAGMPAPARTRNQEGWMRAPGGVAVATNAFGMGINKPDTRFVVHYNLPGTLEAYYQEAGRAGRDGLPADCVLLFSYKDRMIQEYFIDKIGEPKDGSDEIPNEDRIAALKEHATEKLELVVRYAQTHRCRRQMILDYFGDESEATDCDCDVCRAGRGGTLTAGGIEASGEVNQAVRKMLSGVARLSLKGSFGVGVIADVLSGQSSEKTQRWRFEELTVFGLMKEYASKRLVQMLYRLMEAGLARQKDPAGQKFRPVVELTPAGVAVMKGQQRAPGMLADLLGHAPSPRGARSKTKKAVKQVAPEATLDPQVEQRLQRLKAVRTELARQRQLPAYCICHDATLAAIAAAAPGNLAALELIKGMGPNKVKLYGEAMLEALK